MLIFLEGPDGGGKTTLAEKMSSELGFKIAHFSYPKSQHEKDTMFEMYADFIYNTRDAIVDRCWYSDMVYAPLVRKEARSIGIKKMYELEKLVISQGGGMVIHCTDGIHTLWRRFKERGDDYISQDFNLLANIKKEYELLLHKTAHLIPVFRYSVNENLPKL